MKFRLTTEILFQSKNCGRNGIRGNTCAIALCIREVFPDAYVALTKVYPDGITKPTGYQLPQNVIEFIRLFDNTEDISTLPLIEFEIPNIKLAD